MKYTSTCELIEKLNYDKAATVKKLIVSKEELALHRKRLSDLFKNDKPEQIDRKVYDIVMRNNAFAAIMENVVEKSFDFNITDEDVNNLIEDTKKKIIANRDEAYKKAPKEEQEKFGKIEDQPYFKLTDQERINLAKGQIKKDLVFEALAKLWDIFVTDEEVKEQLDNFYKVSNMSIREYLNNPERFESVRNMIRNEKIAKEVLNRFKVIWDLPKPPAQPKKEEDKK